MRSSPRGDVALEPEPYNPLEKEALAKSVRGELLLREPHQLDDVPDFFGPGIYVLYYHGMHPLYAPISGTEQPIYVGKAVPSGGRKGLTDSTRRGKALRKRIEEHRESVTQARDLDVGDFRVRYLVVDELFISLAERLMIRTSRPVWNQVVDGFGNHDPGEGRYDGKVPGWDTLHPGRPWVANLRRPGKYTRDQLIERVNEHFGA